MHSELTFIILARTSDGELVTTDIPTLPMVGDVNVFLNGTPGDLEFESEAEIMIAGELTLCGASPFPNTYISTSTLLPSFAASELIRTFFFSFLRSSLSPTRFCNSRSPVDVLVRHRI